jgi:thioredoxin reductase/bacterioferritin-associated ferredoxin
MKEIYDLLIIGAGPAGLAAAIKAARHKISALVLDEQSEAGGQIYRSIRTTQSLRPEIYALLGADYQRGDNLEKAFREAGIEFLSGASVWQVEPNLAAHFLRNGKSLKVRCRSLLAATGAMERPVPIPGWTLPGVMGAAAADVLLKSSGKVPSGRVVLAGSGTLLWLAASRLVSAEVEILVVLETTKYAYYLHALPYLPQALRASEYLLKGLRLKRQVWRAGIPVFSGIRKLRAEGEQNLKAVHFYHRGQSNIFETETLLVHEGIVPNTQLTRQLSCEHCWYERQRYWHPLLDEWGNTSVDGVAVAGDGGIIAGALTAEASGHLSALESAFQLGVISKIQRDNAAKSYRKTIWHHQAVRPFLEHLFPPNPEILVPLMDSTLVCRCEEVTAGQIINAVKLGALDLSQLKAFTRCGMGTCQGRMCALTVAEIAANIQGKSPKEVGSFRGRPPLKPITLGQLADSAD